ncbi:MAG: hypothetical protein HYW07_16940 [Candidatus Latescibacteria bacterium]|nr:hypothetical protein [Candidatus Latescibacterota bacterium]
MQNATGRVVANTNADGIRYFKLAALWVRQASASPKRGCIAITEEQLANYLNRGQLPAYAQFVKIVTPGMVNTAHIFRGLKRPLRNDDDPNTDEKKLVYVWTPPRDFEWQGGPVPIPRRPRHVFVTIVTPNNLVEEFPDVDGWLERWNWVRESPKYQGHPLDWRNRYTTKLWSRP